MARAEDGSQQEKGIWGHITGLCSPGQAGRLCRETRGCFAWTWGRIWPFEFGVYLGEGQGSLCWRHGEKPRHHTSVCSSDAWCCAGEDPDTQECHGYGLGYGFGSCVTQCSSQEPSLQAGIAQSTLVESSLTGNE